MQRLAYGKSVVSRGPELRHSSYADGHLVLSFSNQSLQVHEGILVPPPPGGCATPLVPAVDVATAAAPPAEPLDCFDVNAPGAPAICFGQYPIKLPKDGTPAACAASCLKDAECTQFVWGEEPKCRLSHTCRQPTRASRTFEGYMRNCTRPGCECWLPCNLRRGR